MNDWETFQAAYQTAPAATKALVDSETIPNAVQEQVALGTIDQPLQATVIKLCSHFVLGMTSEPNVLLELQKLGIPNAAVVFGMLKGNFTVDTPTPTALNTELSTEIAEVEHNLSDMPPVRTMADDIIKIQQTETTQPSLSQAELLQKSTEESDEARWGRTN